MPEGVQVRVPSTTPSTIVVRVSGQQTVSALAVSEEITLRMQGRGPEGPTGPVGPAGVEVVEHGADPNVARPVGVPVVYWIGSVPPADAEPFDLWYIT
jgi:hypothetical protein